MVSPMRHPEPPGELAAIKQVRADLRGLREAPCPRRVHCRCVEEQRAAGQAAMSTIDHNLRDAAGQVRGSHGCATRPDLRSQAKLNWHPP